jgi:hypothetical protein
MNDMSLSRLYRRLVSTRPHPAVDDAELVDALAPEAPAGEIDARRAATIEKLASSPAHSALARMLQALRPDSEALASQVNERRRVAHPTRQREQRVAAGARRHPLRWAGSIAAMALAFGLSTWHGTQTQHRDNVAAASGQGKAAPSSDRIFTADDRIFASSTDTHSRGGDELFRGSFSSGG